MHAHAAVLALDVVGLDVVVSDQQRRWIVACLAILLALLAAWVVNHAFARRGRRLAASVGRGLSPEADTRLRFVRRLLVAAIVLFGFAVAIGQFEGFSRLATSLLASGAIAAAVIGFAARQTLANLVAGVMIAVTQPVRVGDWVTFEDIHGEVEDVRLNYTYLRTPGRQRIVIPNEKLASGILRNDTLASDLIEVEVSVWLPPTADTDRAIAVLESHTGYAVTVAETRPDGVRLAVTGEPAPPPERGRLEGELRTRCLSHLRADGLLPATPPAGLGTTAAN